MWLLKAVGVHDQHAFTFALERGKSYTIGRDKGCDIPFKSKRLRTLEGTLEVGDWSLTDPDTKPSVKYKIEPKKGKKEYPPYTCLLITNEDELGTTNLDEYDKMTIEGGEISGGTQGRQGAFLSDHIGQGVYYDDDAWFTLIWKDMYIVWDKMKDETDELRESLKRFCIAWTPSYEPESPRIPNYVISQTLKANQECNYAVCNAVRILLPSFLRDIVRNMVNCWKTRADSQDSFKIPDEESAEYLPPFDTGLQSFRSNVESWLPDERRKTLFKGYKVLVLRSKAQPGEKRYLLATGAELQDIDIISQPLQSAADFSNRISSWLREVDEHERGRDKALVGFFGQVKKNLSDSGKDFVKLVEGPCRRLGIPVVPGSIIWHAMRLGSVQAYLDTSPLGPRTDAASATMQTRRTQVPETAAPMVAETRSLTPPPDSTAPPSQPSPTQRRVAASVIAETEPTKQESSTNMDRDPPSAQPPSTARRTLKRRAGKPMIDLYVEPIAETVEEEQAQGSLGSEPKSQEMATQLPSGQPAPSQSYVPESVMPSQTQSMGRSRLKRRAGTQAPMVDYTIPEHSMMPSTQDMRPEIKEVYDQAMSSHADQPSVPKRARLASVDESREQTPVDTQQTQGGMDVDEHGDEGLDFVEKTLKDAAKAKKEGRQASRILMPPPTQLPSKVKSRRTGRSPSEETEPLEPPRNSKIPSPVKGTQKTQDSAKTKPPSTQDTAFLTAIAKNAKSKKAVDELDKEFNQLRIPKPGANPGSNVIKASAWDANHPDWNLVNEFDDDMRGNFIQIVRMDLMRKDGGRKVATGVDDGKPNFKKFKKKEVMRREPVRMILAAPSTNDAEMGEPYWPTQQVNGKGKSKTQISLTQQDEDEDEDMPLLPKSRRRLLSPGHDDEMSPPPPTARGRGKATPSQTPAASQVAPRRTTQRQFRETSVNSDTSSIGTVGQSTRTRATPAATQRKGKTQPIVIEESEDEVNRDLGPARSSTGTARGKSSRATGSGMVGDDEASNVTATATGRKATQSSLGTGRRRLVVDDDDDGELVFKGAAKKRRL